MPLFDDTIHLGSAVVDQVVNAFALAGDRSARLIGDVT
jgi:hypothetical protein